MSKSIAEGAEAVEGKEERSYGSLIMERLTGSVEGRIDHMLQVRNYTYAHIHICFHVDTLLIFVPNEIIILVLEVAPATLSTPITKFAYTFAIRLKSCISFSLVALFYHLSSVAAHASGILLRLCVDHAGQNFPTSIYISDWFTYVCLIFRLLNT